MKVGILLTPSFLELEAALVMELSRQLGWECFTVARGRTALEGAAGAVWTPKFTFVARPELDLLVIPGGANMSKLGRDEQHQDWLAEIWDNQKAIFCGANAALLLLEAGRISGKIAAHPIAKEALAGTALELLPQKVYWSGKVCTTRGYMDLGRAMLEWAGFADATKEHLGL